MNIQGTNVLFVGPGFHTSQVLAERMRLWGFQCHFAGSIRAAREMVNSARVDLVLSSVRLPDGTGFSLIASLSGRPVTAFLCLPVEDSCFWLPAIDEGKDCMGSPALRPSEFVSALEEMFHRLPCGSQVH